MEEEGKMGWLKQLNNCKISTKNNKKISQNEAKVMPLFLKGRKKTDGKRIVLMPKKHQLKINVSGINNNNNSRTYGIKDSRLYNKSYQNLAVDSIANNKGGGNSRILSANFLNENYSKSNNKRSKSITGCSSINSSSILMNKHLFDKVSNNKSYNASNKEKFSHSS